MRTAWILCLLAAGGAAGAGERAEQAALREAAKVFLTEARGEGAAGLPGEERMKGLRGLLTPELGFILEKARERQAEQMAKHPDEKPEWVEDDLFSSHAAGVTQWEAGRVFWAPTVDATVEVGCVLKEPGEAEVRWTDKLVFKRKGDGWRLDDIRFGGEWVEDGQSLRSLLPGGRQETESHESPDGRWRVEFAKEEGATSRVELRAAGGRSGVTLFADEAEPAGFGAWVLWSPTADKVAVTAGRSPQMAETRVFCLEGEEWKRVEVPELYPAERKVLEENGFEEQHRRLEAHHWADAYTLVIDYFGQFTKGDEGDGFDKQVSLRILPGGKATVTGAVEKDRE